MGGGVASAVYSAFFDTGAAKRTELGIEDVTGMAWIYVGYFSDHAAATKTIQ